MSRRIYERSPLSCSHPIDRQRGARCTKCGAKVQVKLAPPPPAFKSEFSDDAMAYGEAEECAILAARERAS